MSTREESMKVGLGAPVLVPGAEQVVSWAPSAAPPKKQPIRPDLLPQPALARKWDWDRIKQLPGMIAYYGPGVVLDTLKSPVGLAVLTSALAIGGIWYAHRPRR